MPLPTEALERELEESDKAVAADPKNPLLQQRFGHASLDLGRRYAEDQLGQGPPERERRDQADRHADSGRAHSLEDDQPDDVADLRARRADRSLCRGAGPCKKDAVDPTAAR
jgi:hypothetical protein